MPPPNQPHSTDQRTDPDPDPDFDFDFDFDFYKPSLTGQARAAMTIKQ
ncbi:hypothetical protein AcdelDRAFT_3900 [Acidovorax delafieldii 2AN]|uniref:Uncharacterized protein n=1 Tax=Acidovorax delafieldii 2AN TaxID=573060 RepID=C5TAH0_ACIDE|nr:hypothetical protein [Acidovorax delafieldii]EER58524.1 hypothetical protein AcdelDRAFT_3900 [Acidovorax delafieldii 2AN]